MKKEARTISSESETKSGLFDQWPVAYDSWFTTPIGVLVKKYETELLMEMLSPQDGEIVLDVGCGTGLFSTEVLAAGARVTGLDISYPMLSQAVKKTQDQPFAGVIGDMASLPFPDNYFDKVYSMTALEFVDDAKQAVHELNRVARKKGTIVMTTLNSLSPWARRRKKKAENGHSLFKNMCFRSPADLTRLVPGYSNIKTAIHFLKSTDPEKVPAIEEKGNLQGKQTGAFLALSWQKL